MCNSPRRTHTRQTHARTHNQEERRSDPNWRSWGRVPLPAEAFGPKASVLLLCVCVVPSPLKSNSMWARRPTQPSTWLCFVSFSNILYIIFLFFFLLLSFFNSFSITAKMTERCDFKTSSLTLHCVQAFSVFRLESERKRKRVDTFTEKKDFLSYTEEE